MRYSQTFTKTQKTVKEETESINAQLLTRAGFIHQELAGVYTFLPFGLRVLRKIEDIVRVEMDKIGVEVLMPTLSLQTPWQQTGRLEKVDVLFKAQGANDASRQKNDAEYVINYSHEEIITPLVQSFVQSYKDLPKAVYQIQTKFRNEARAKSGLLRGREFRMKDLYSFHHNEAELQDYYEQAKVSYMNAYKALGIGDDTYVTYASGGDFTTEYSHEFQTVLPSGEDTIYLDRDNRVAYNKEIVTDHDAKKLGVDFSKLEQVKACEVGNIFPLGTRYSKDFDFTYVDENNKPQLVVMGCYGLGTSRVMGVIVEKFADDKGLVWPAQIAPFQYHLISLQAGKPMEEAEKIYDQLGAEKCLWDDRADKSPGEKFADADLIGCPIQIIVSERSLAENSVEVKSRTGAFESRLVKLTDTSSLKNL